MKKMLIAVLALIISVSLFAIPADSTPRTLKLKDGRMLTISLQGDEHLSWAKSSDGYTLLLSEKGDWMFACLNSDGDLVPSSIMASDPAYRTAEEQAALNGIDKNLKFSAVQLQKRNESKLKQMNTKASFPLSGSPKLLVVLVDFSDRPFTTQHSYWDSIAGVAGATSAGATGSLRDYYYDNSMGVMDLDVTVVGPYRMPQALSFYGRNQNGGDANVYRLVSDAVRIIDTAVDFSLYDNDNNDTLDNIHIIFAGIPESTSGEANAIWPHKSILYNLRVEVDGVRVYTYSCSGEKKSAGMADGIGAMCHEFGHVLGLPDFYDTDGDTGNGDGVGLGNFSLMHGGCYNNDSRTPSGLSSIEREILNWHTHTTLTDPAVITIGNLADSNVSYKITTYNAREYYIIDNRQRSGWDAYNPDGGMLIYHVDKNVAGWNLNGYNSNQLNTNPTHQGCYIVSANGDSSNYSMTTAYPLTTNDRFTPRTTPSSWTWYDVNGYNTGHSFINKPISHIKEIDSTTLIQFNYMLLDTFPLISITSVSGITSSSVVVASNIVDTQRVNVTSRGICWSTSPDPILAEGNYIADSLACEGIYTLTIDNLERGTHYYVRAYAINQYCTTYSSSTLEFSTLSGAPLITTRTAANITSSNALLRAIIDDSVDAPVVRQGFLVSTSEDFDTTGSATMTIDVDSVDNIGYFSYELSSLTEYTRYYVKAFAQNAYGIAYGNVVNFTTEFERIENNEISGDQVYCGLENREPLAVDTLFGEEPIGRTAPYTYLWQYKTLTTSWVDAPGVNNEINYYPGSISDSSYFRRLVYSTGIYDTSSTVLIAIKYSRGGNVSFSLDTVNVNERIGRFRVQGSKGSVVQWERRYENEEWIVIAGAEATIYDTLPAPGNYYYRAKVQLDDCVPAYSSEKQVYAKQKVGIDAVASSDLEVSFVPNPSTGKFTIVSASDEVYNLQVLSMDGKLLYAENDVKISGKTMDLTSLPSGMYIMVISNQMEQTTRRIVINK